MQNHEKVQKAVRFIHARTTSSWNDATETLPQLGLVLGTGLGALAEAASPIASIDYHAIPGFPTSSVASHAGRLILGRLAGIPLWILSGRCHLYEGYTPAQTCMGVRTLAGLGVRTLIITNASGALNPAYNAGTPMLIADHLNCTGQSPLTGPNHDAWGERFPDMTGVYPPRLREIALRAAHERGLPLECGVYAQVPGPQIETPAETRMYRTLGADAIGMSTVLEAIAARHMGVEVLGFSCLANKNDPDAMRPVHFADVVATVGAAAQIVRTLIMDIVPML
ncbi:MAG: purine-nucleoside phosphorylase [Desulfovibrionaceae bacterium]